MSNLITQDRFVDLRRCSFAKLFIKLFKLRKIVFFLMFVEWQKLWFCDLWLCDCDFLWFVDQIWIMFFDWVKVTLILVHFRFMGSLREVATTINQKNQKRKFVYDYLNPGIAAPQSRWLRLRKLWRIKLIVSLNRYMLVYELYGIKLSWIVKSSFSYLTDLNILEITL